MLHMHCYKVAKLQHLIVAEYYTYSFSADFMPIITYYIAVHIICYIPSVEYLLYMQLNIEWFNAALNTTLSSAALIDNCFINNYMINTPHIPQ